MLQSPSTTLVDPLLNVPCKLGFAKPKSQTTLKVREWGHDFPRWPHYQPTLRDALKACTCPRKLTLLASSLGAKFPQPQSRSPILI